VFYFHGHQKGVHLWQRGAIQGDATEVGGAIAPNCPPGSATEANRFLNKLANVVWT